MLEFSEKQIVGKAKIELPLSANDIETIMVTALEGGINYWARLARVGQEWEECPREIPSSQWATKLLIEGKTVYLIEDEDGTINPLTLQGLIRGFTQNYRERPHDNDIEQGDAITADCIVQYAVFNKLVYG